MLTLKDGGLPVPEEHFDALLQLPQVSGADGVRALQKLGFTVRRQHGSHIILRRDNLFAQTVVPNHRQLNRGTLRAIL